MFDLVKRVNLRTVNKKSFDSLAQAGAFDSLGDQTRSQYLEPFDSSGQYFIEKIIKFGQQYQADKEKNTNSLFGGDMLEEQLIEPEFPQLEPWDSFDLLRKEKAVTGIYISGHPLDEYEWEVNQFATCSLSQLEAYKGKRVRIAAIVASFTKRVDKKGRPFGIALFEDFDGQYENATI